MRTIYQRTPSQNNVFLSEGEGKMGELFNRNGRDWTWVLGAGLIVLGGLYLLGQFLPGVFSSLIWAAGFFAFGLVFYFIHQGNRSQGWALIPAYAMFSVGAVILLSGFIGGQLMGAFVMFAIAAPFVYVYLNNRYNWWALIPAYVMAAIGGLILLDPIMGGSMTGAYVMFAIAAPFIYVYLRNTDNWWALIPGGMMAVIGAGLLISSVISAIPVLLIIAGIYILVRQMGSKSQDNKPQPIKVSTPTSGPEADKAPAVEERM
jgi:hypothetical protein